MKKIITAVIAIMLTISVFAQEGKALYKKYSEYDAVETVHISPAMFRMMGKLPDMNVEGNSFNLSSVIPAPCNR